MNYETKFVAKKGFVEIPDLKFWEGYREITDLKDGIRHEELLISNLKKQGHKVAKLSGKQNESDYEDTKKAMVDGCDYIWQASLKNKEMRGSADLLKRIEANNIYRLMFFQTCSNQCTTKFMGIVICLVKSPFLVSSRR